MQKTLSIDIIKNILNVQPATNIVTVKNLIDAYNSQVPVTDVINRDELVYELLGQNDAIFATKDLLANGAPYGEIDDADVAKIVAENNATYQNVYDNGDEFLYAGHDFVIETLNDFFKQTADLHQDIQAQYQTVIRKAVRPMTAGAILNTIQDFTDLDLDDHTTDAPVVSDDDDDKDALPL